MPLDERGPEVFATHPRLPDYEREVEGVFGFIEKYVITIPCAFQQGNEIQTESIRFGSCGSTISNAYSVIINEEPRNVSA